MSFVVLAASVLIGSVPGWIINLFLSVIASFLRVISVSVSVQRAFRSRQHVLSSFESHSIRSYSENQRFRAISACVRQLDTKASDLQVAGLLWINSVTVTDFTVDYILLLPVKKVQVKV